MRGKCFVDATSHSFNDLKDHKHEDNIEQIAYVPETDSILYRLGQEKVVLRRHPDSR